MSTQRIIRIAYQQELTVEAEQPRWSETFDVSISFFADALTSGWLGQFCGHHGTDLVVLIAIGLHARPLRGEFFQELLGKGLISAADEGRLYATVSDLGLSRELGNVKRDTIAAATQRLARRGLLTICDLRPTAPGDPERRRPLQVGSSHQFTKSKIYIIAGNLSNVLSKDVVRAQLSGTGRSRLQIARAPVSGTDSDPANRAEAVHESGTNKGSPGGGGGVAPDPDFEMTSHFQEAAVAHFAERQGQPVTFSEKESAALRQLQADGYTVDEIRTGIDAAFARPTPPRSFALCARIIRNQPPLTRQPASTSPAPEPERAARSQPEAEARHGEADVEPSARLLPELAEAAERLIEAGEALTPARITRLNWMGAQFDEAARARGSTGPAWVTQALAHSLGVAKDVIPYAQRMLERWRQNGPDQPRPAGNVQADRPRRSSTQRRTGGFQRALERSRSADRD